MNRYTVTKSPLVPVGNTPAIPKPWNLYNETKDELVSCHATRGLAIRAMVERQDADDRTARRAEMEATRQARLDDEKALAERVEFARRVARAGEAFDHQHRPHPNKGGRVGH